MIITPKKEAGALTVKLDGRLDSTTAGELEETLKKELDDSVSALTIDLADVDFVSSKGLRVLVGAYRTMKGREMALTGANESIREVLRLSGLLKIFNVK